MQSWLLFLWKNIFSLDFISNGVIWWSNHNQNKEEWQQKHVLSDTVGSNCVAPLQNEIDQSHINALKWQKSVQTIFVEKFSNTTYFKVTMDVLASNTFHWKNECMILPMSFTMIFIAHPLINMMSVNCIGHGNKGATSGRTIMVPVDHNIIRSQEPLLFWDDTYKADKLFVGWHAVTSLFDVTMWQS